MKQIILLTLALMLGNGIIYAQNAAIKGTVKDETGEPLIGAGISLYKEGVNVSKGAVSDFDGNYYIGGLDAGIYDVEVKYLGYNTLRQTGVKVLSGQVYTLDLSMVDESNALSEVVIRAEKPSPVKLGNATQGMTLTSEDIKSKGTRSLNTLRSTSAKVSSTDEGREIRKKTNAAELGFNHDLTGTKVRKNKKIIRLPQRRKILFPPTESDTKHGLKINFIK